MPTTCIAVDIGASSGRLIAGWIENNKLQIKEIHRFPNGMIKRDGHYYWEIDRLFGEIQAGLAKIDTPYASVGIDTWGVDYALLDERDNRLGEVYAYRDHRTDGYPDKIDKEAVYQRSGLQFNLFNTLFQLMAHEPKGAAHFLTVPDYLHYRLCGVKACELSIASTTQLLDVHTGDWDPELVAMTGFPMEMFPKVVAPGTVLGDMLDKPGVKVIMPASHDTGSAVAAVPATEGSFAYISSGTWSLMGIESDKPCLLSQTFTNERGVFGTYRILKNIMGLWMLQEVRRLWPEKLSFAQLEEMAAASDFAPIVDVADNRFLSPESMIEEIKNACREQGGPVPETAGEMTRCIYNSLAESYRLTLEQIREFAPVDRIHIIGGGSQDNYLNRLTAEKTGCKVIAGPTEATAIGNLLMQMIALGEIKDLAEGRKLVADSFALKEF